MIKKRLAFFVLILFGLSFLSLHAEVILDMKLRFYEGVREGKVEPTRFVTSSFLQPIVAATIKSKFLLAEEQEQIKKVFNLKGVNLITEADLRWSSKKGKITHIFRLDGKEYLLSLNVITKEYRVYSKSDKDNLTHQLKIEMFEQSEGSKTSLLDTEFILPSKNIWVNGFEDRQGNPYFLSLHISGIKAVPEAPPPPPSPPSPPPPAKQKKFATPEEIKEFAKGAVEVTGMIKPPKLIKKVEPIYPVQARQARVEGVVILGVRTDINGRVKSVKVYKSKDPLLNQPSIDAVRQWVYEPLIIKGKPREVVFTVTVRFKLKGKKTDDFAEGVVRALGEIKPPKRIKKVDPIYPEDVRKEGIQGVVILEAVIDEYGRVAMVRVLKSESSMLNKPAIDAVRQWVYEPFIKDGKPVPICFTVTIKFKLK